MQQLDHLVYATKDLDGTVLALEARLGVRASPGGRHPGLGTRNAILALSATSYLEVIGPDETQPVPAAPRWFGIDTLLAPRLVAWAVKDSAPEARAAQALAAGFRLGPVEAGSRERPDGKRLAWRFTHPRVLAADGVVPFFIDWGEGAHPAQAAPTGVRFIGLRAEHPKPEPIVALLKEFGLPVHVKRGPAALVAMLDTPRGAVELS
jgi:hypothetical protein